MKLFDYIKTLIKNSQEKNRVEKERLFNEKRERTIRFIDHKWTQEEYDRYNYHFMVVNEFNIGPYTAAEYQERKLRDIQYDNEGLLSKEEIKKFEKDVQIRMLEEKRDELIMKSPDHQIQDIEAKIRKLKSDI